MAERISQVIDAQLDGAEDTTAAVRGAERVGKAGGCTFLNPTAVRVPNSDHPLANAEYLFPFASVVEAPQAEMVERMGPSLVVTAITEDQNFIDQLLAFRT